MGHGRRPCKFFLAGVNFYRFNAKIGNLLCKLAIYCVNFGVNFIFQKFCPCKKMTNMRYDKNVMKTVQSFFCIELQYLKSSSGGHLSKRKRAGHVKQKTRLKTLCIFCAFYEKKNIF